MDLLDLIKEAGVIGAGGAGFPTHIKLNAKAEYILLNGAECEPLLRVDQQIMEKYPEEIIKGLLVGKQITGADKAIIGIKYKHHDVIDILNKKIDELGIRNEMEVGILPDVYPAGDEQVLVYELTGRVVVETGIPLSVGCVVINSETALNIYHASMNEPVTTKYITIAGDVPNPITIKAYIGTPIKDILQLAGFEDFDSYSIIDGGPMMGPLLNNIDSFVTKKTKGLVILPKSHHLIQKKNMSMKGAIVLNRSACEQCSLCTDLCPRSLMGHSTVPHKMVRAMEYGIEADANTSAALTCCQCNLCEYFSCPAGINPKMANVYYMGKLREKGIKHTPKTSFKPHSMRDYRQIPSKRLIARLNLSNYDKKAPLNEDLIADSTIFGISLNSHVGAPAIPIVNIGDRVSKNQMIAVIKEGSLGANVHSGIDGIVESIENNLIMIRR